MRACRRARSSPYCASALRLVLTAPCPPLRAADLHVEETISLADALVGFQRELEHLDGRRVPLARAGVTRPGEVVRVAGEGMPVFEGAGRRGDLHVRYTVAFPRELREKDKKAVREMFAAADWRHDEL